MSSADECISTICHLRLAEHIDQAVFKLSMRLNNPTTAEDMHTYLSAASWGSCLFLLFDCRQIRQALIHAATKGDMSTLYLDHKYQREYCLNQSYLEVSSQPNPRQVLTVEADCHKFCCNIPFCLTGVCDHAGQVSRMHSCCQSIALMHACCD